jgi:hypothetical protein
MLKILHSRKSLSAAIAKGDDGGSLEFQVTSLPKSYFNIFKELRSALLADDKDTNFIVSAQYLFQHLTPLYKPSVVVSNLFRTLLLKSGCKDKRFILESPNNCRNFFCFNSIQLKI